MMWTYLRDLKLPGISYARILRLHATRSSTSQRRAIFPSSVGYAASKTSTAGKGSSGAGSASMIYEVTSKEIRLDVSISFHPILFPRYPALNPTIFWPK